MCFPLFHLEGGSDFVSDRVVNFYGSINLDGGNAIVGGGDIAGADSHLSAVIKGLAHIPALGAVEFPVAADGCAVSIAEDESIQVGNIQFGKTVTLELAEVLGQPGGAGSSHFGSNCLEVKTAVILFEGVARTNVCHFNLHGGGSPVASYGSELRQSFGRGDAGAVAVGGTVVGVVGVD